MSDSITMREAWRLDIEELKAERDEARETVAMLHGHASILAQERNEARRLAQWFYTRLKQVCLEHPLEGNVGSILARLEEAVLDDPWLEAAK